MARFCTRKCAEYSVNFGLCSSAPRGERKRSIYTSRRRKWALTLDITYSSYTSDRVQPREDKTDRLSASNENASQPCVVAECEKGCVSRMSTDMYLIYTWGPRVEHLHPVSRCPRRWRFGDRFPRTSPRRPGPELTDRDHRQASTSTRPDVSERTILSSFARISGMRTCRRRGPWHRGRLVDLLQSHRLLGSGRTVDRGWPTCQRWFGASCPMRLRSSLK